MDLSWLQILVAEDNEVNQKLIAKILASIGILPENIVVVGDGKKAFEVVQAIKFDVVLMDTLVSL